MVTTVKIIYYLEGVQDFGGGFQVSFVPGQHFYEYHVVTVRRLCRGYYQVLPTARAIQRVVVVAQVESIGVVHLPTIVTSTRRLPGARRRAGSSYCTGSRAS